MAQTLQGRTNVCRRRWTFGRPSTNTTPENIANVPEAILADRRQTIHDVCEIVGLSYGTVQRILADNLNMRRISARFVPGLLSDDDQKAHRVSVCRKLKQQTRCDPNFVSNIIAGDETWVYGYDPEIKQHSSQWKSPNLPRPKKARQVHSNFKYMLIVFSTSKTLSTRNSCPLVKPSMASFTVRFWSGWGRAFDANVQTSGRTIGFSIMTTRLLTHHSLFNNSWLPKTLQWSPPLFAWPHPLRICPIPQDEITAEWASFWHDWGDPRRIARGYRHTHIWEIPGMHEIMGNTLG